MAAVYNQGYFDALTEGLPVTVAQIDASVGKGVVARAPIAGGAVVWEEPPLVAIQHVYNTGRATVCQHCFRFIGSIQSQFNKIVKITDLVLPLIGGTDPTAVLTPEIPCGMGCGTRYCSAQCQQAAWDSWHRLLCPSTDPEHAVVLLGQFSESTNDIFLLAARALAGIIQQFQKNGGDLAAAEAAYSVVFKAPWWEVVDSGQNAFMTPDEHREYLSTFHTLVEEACCFYRAIFPADPALATLVSKEYVGHLLGLFELNNARMTVQSPLGAYAHAAKHALGDSWQSCDWLSQLHESLSENNDHHHGDEDWDDMDEDDEMEDADAGDKGKAPEAPMSEELPDILLEGNALYRLQSCVNHSCVPNAALVKSSGDHDGRVVVRALRDIRPGEELTISYIDEALPYDERREELQEYHFVCRCPKCLAKA